MCWVGWPLFTMYNNHYTQLLLKKGLNTTLYVAYRYIALLFFLVKSHARITTRAKKAPETPGSMVMVKKKGLVLFLGSFMAISASPLL